MFSYSKTHNFKYFRMIGCCSSMHYCIEKWYVYDFDYSVSEKVILV